MVIASVILCAALVLESRDARANLQLIAHRLTDLNERGITPVARVMWAITKGRLAVAPPAKPLEWDAAGPMSHAFRAVVANEIRGLSAQSQETSSRIEAVHDTVSTSMEYMQRNRTAATEINGTFEEINRAVQANSHAMTGIDRELDAIKDQIASVEASADQFKDRLDALRSGLQEGVTANQEIAAAVHAVSEGNDHLRTAATIQDRMLRGFEV